MESSNQPKDIEMTKQEYADFVAGVRENIESKGLKHREVAIKAGRSPVNFSKVLNLHNGCSVKYRKDICDAMGVSEIEMVKLGESLRETKTSDATQTIPIGPTDFIDPDHVVSAVMTLVRQCRKTDDRLRYWRTVYESLPVSVIVVKNGIVMHQNQRGKEIWGQVSGSAPCAHCVGRGICDPSECAIQEAMASGVATTRYKLMGGEVTKVSVVPVHLKEADYYIAVAVHIDMAAAAAVQKKAAKDTPKRRKEDRDEK